MNDCNWCGGEIEGRPFRDRSGGEFCSRAHRDASTRAVRRLRERCETPGKPEGPRVGDRVVLACDVERFPFAIVPAGSGGVVDDVQPDGVWVRLDVEIDGIADRLVHFPTDEYAAEVRPA